MSDNSRIRSWLTALLASAGMAAAYGAAPAAPAPSDSEPATVRVQADEDLDAQLDAARKKLEEAAHEVARLSSQLSGAVIEGMMSFDGPEPLRAVIGVQLDPADGTSGARVREVSPGGPAAEAGIRAGDVLVAINGTEIKGSKPARQVVTVMRHVKPDSKVNVRVLREGKTLEFTVTARPGPMVFAAGHGMPDIGYMTFPGLAGPFMLHGPITDMELATLTPRLGSYFGADKGVLVVRAPSDRALKLEDGDVIVAIDGREPTSGSHATRILGSYQPGEKVTLRILRQHKSLDLETTLPERAGPMHMELERHLAVPNKDLERHKLTILGGDNV